MSKYFLYAYQLYQQDKSSNNGVITNASAQCLQMCPEDELKRRISNTHDSEYEFESFSFLRFTESEQQDKIHFLEGADPSVIDDETGQPINQNELLVKVYVRSNTDEERNIYSIRFHFYAFCSLDLLLFLSEWFCICFITASI